MRIPAAVVIAILCIAESLAAQGTGSLHVRARTEAGTPLANSLLSIPELGVSRFTGITGAVTLAGLEPGAVRIQLRRLGFQPKDTTVDVVAGATTSVDVTLARVALRLVPVRVVAHERCDHPGPPADSADAALASAFQQLRMNASQYLSLVHAYPFSYLMRRVFGHRSRAGARVIEETDSIRISGIPKWSYAPGRVVTQSPEQRRNELFMHLPTMEVFADSVFIANHCFHSGGVEQLENGVSHFRIDFIPASSLRTSDIAGSIYLDVESLIVRRTLLRLTRLPRIRGLLGLEVTTEFIEVAPSIPVIHEVHSKHAFDRRAGHPELFEEQRLIRIDFVHARPSGTSDDRGSWQSREPRRLFAQSRSRRPPR